MNATHKTENAADLAVNLDCEFLDPEDLQAWEPDAARLTARECGLLRRYRNKKVLAMKARLAGDIQTALLWESHCEDDYECMSERIRW